jgi:hypothetical protein
MKKPPRGRGRAVQHGGQFSLRRSERPSPARPGPSSESVGGSGTGAETAMTRPAIHNRGLN